jgi:glycosyltransferase involved in cell wall biosynthesis
VTLASSDTDFYELDSRIERVGLGLTRETGGIVQATRENLRRALAIRRALRATGPDRAVSFGDIMNCLVLLAASGTGTRTIVSERNDPRHLAMHQPWATLRSRLYPRADAVVVQTAGVADWARRHLPSARTVVIPNFVCPRPGSRYPTGPDGAQERRLVGMGRLTPQKGFDLLIAAFARVAPAHPEWRLVIAGDGQERSRLEALVSELGLDTRVALPGVLNANEHLASADMFVLSSRFEGFPNALMEAMAAGLPVVSFDCQSGPREIIRDGTDGILVPNEDVTSLAAQLDRLMSDEPARLRLGRAATEVVERFSLERVMAQWEELVDAA